MLNEKRPCGSLYGWPAPSTGNGVPAAAGEAVRVLGALAVARTLTVAVAATVGTGAAPLRVAEAGALLAGATLAAGVVDAVVTAAVVATISVVAVGEPVLHAVSSSPNASNTTIACFLTSLFLLIAGRRSVFVPPRDSPFIVELGYHGALAEAPHRAAFRKKLTVSSYMRW